MSVAPGKGRERELESQLEVRSAPSGATGGPVGMPSADSGWLSPGVPPPLGSPGAGSCDPPRNRPTCASQVATAGALRRRMSARRALQPPPHRGKGASWSPKAAATRSLRRTAACCFSRARMPSSSCKWSWTHAGAAKRTCRRAPCCPACAAGGLSRSPSISDTYHACVLFTRSDSRARLRRSCSRRWGAWLRWKWT